MPYPRALRRALAKRPSRNNIQSLMFMVDKYPDLANLLETETEERIEYLKTHHDQTIPPPEPGATFGKYTKNNRRKLDIRMDGARKSILQVTRKRSRRQRYRRQQQLRQAEMEIANL